MSVASRPVWDKETEPDGPPNAVPLAAVTGLHDVDEYMQAQLLLAVSNLGCPCLSLDPSCPSPPQP